MRFDKYNHGAFVKLESELKDVDGTFYPIAIIMTTNNVYRKEIAGAFSILISGANNEK